MKLLIGVTGIIPVLLLASLTLFGQSHTSPSDSINIVPQQRYVERGDTFTVFSIDSERKIVTLLSYHQFLHSLNRNLTSQLTSMRNSLMYHTEQINVLDSISDNQGYIIEKQDSIINNKDREISLHKDRLEHERKRKWYYLGVGASVGILIGVLVN